ncbi:hypothetical protein AMECASPLE_007801 [Ameca splendens]|uniref:Uncharacterized protein n=1 Tax=Ameca splendens TaxID=208324 RepID=A0ABV0YZG2_9TELE
MNFQNTERILSVPPGIKTHRTSSLVNRTGPKLLQTIRSAERIIRDDLPSIQNLYKSRVNERAANISADPTHPGHSLDFYLQDVATEQCLLKPATTETVSSPRLSLL